VFAAGAALAGCAGVVSFSHEFLVEMFRTRGELAPAVLWLCAGMRFEHARTEQGSIDLSQVVSTEYRADDVVVLRDRDDAAVAAVIVEVQLGIDRDKERSWPVYIPALRAKLGCRVVLLVVTAESSVARWARRTIELGHPGYQLTPLVMELKDMPRMTDPAAVQAVPELAVLSAMANPDLQVATTAISAISGLPEDQARLYLDVIMAKLPPSVRQALENHMQGYVYQSEFARKYYSQGLEEGRENGLRRAVLAILGAKLDTVTAEDQAMIDALRDDRALLEVIDAVTRATTALEVRAVLGRTGAGAGTGC
jgi:hypothetical protein